MIVKAGGCKSTGKRNLAHIAVIAITVAFATFAHALANSVSFVATVGGQNTIDTLGLFGPTGANLNGALIEIDISYDNADFSPGGQSDSWLSETANALKLSVTINGITHLQKSIGGADEDGFGAGIATYPDGNTPARAQFFASGSLFNYITALINYDTSLLNPSLDHLSQPLPGSTGYAFFYNNNKPYPGNEEVDYNVPGSSPPALDICMGDIDVTKAGVPTPVAVGQQIILNICGGPPSVQSQQWVIPDQKVADFSFANVDCGNTKPACGPCNPTKNCPEVFPNTTGSSVQFYWLDQDNNSSTKAYRSVHYSYILPDGTVGISSADFHVIGPLNINIVPAIGPFVFRGNGVTLGTDTIPGGQFDATGSNPPEAKGTLSWVQLIDSQSVTFTNPGNPGQKVCSSGIGLDNTYPFPGVTTAADNPGASFPRVFPYTYVDAEFAATMYLMWTPTSLNSTPLANSIPVVQGSVSWRFSAVSSRKSWINSWKEVSSATSASADKFVPSSDYPRWDHVVESLIKPAQCITTD